MVWLDRGMVRNCRTRSLDTCLEWYPTAPMHPLLKISHTVLQPYIYYSTVSPELLSRIRCDSQDNSSRRLPSSFCDFSHAVLLYVYPYVCHVSCHCTNNNSLRVRVSYCLFDPRNPHIKLTCTGKPQPMNSQQQCQERCMYG